MIPPSASIARQAALVVLAVIVLPLALCGLSPAQSAPAAAPTFTVNNVADVGMVSGTLDNGICETAPGSGICTLRAAIIKANHWPGGGVTIHLPPPVLLVAPTARLPAIWTSRAT